MIPALNRGEAVAVSAGGEPPALLTSTSSRPWRSTISSISASTWSASRTSAATNSTPGASDVGLVPSAHDDARIVGREPLGDAASDLPDCRR